MIREILKMGDARLLRVARTIEDIHDPALKTVIADMYETMHAANGVGVRQSSLRLNDDGRAACALGLCDGRIAGAPRLAVVKNVLKSNLH
jgi:hypothetical protein